MTSGSTPSLQRGGLRYACPLPPPHTVCDQKPPKPRRSPAEGVRVGEAIKGSDALPGRRLT